MILLKKLLTSLVSSVVHCATVVGEVTLESKYVKRIALVSTGAVVTSSN